jgi:hypothetical protein
MSLTILNIVSTTLIQPSNNLSNHQLNNFNQPSNKWVFLVVIFFHLAKTRRKKGEGGEKGGQKTCTKDFYFFKWSKFASFSEKNNLKSPCLT